MSDSIPCRYPNKELVNESDRFKQSSTITRLHEIIRDVLKRRRITYKKFTDMLISAVINQHLSVSQLLTLRSKLLGLIFGSGRLVYDQFQFIMDMLGENIPDDPEIDHFKNLGIDRDIRGKVFDRLTVLSCVGKKYDSIRYWRCQCQCGNVVEVAVNHLNSGHTTSCGCYATERKCEVHKTHGLRKHPLYNIWSKMLQRCYNPNDPKYPRYGGRGIEVCERWRDNFINFFEDMNPRPSAQHTIDRIDNDGNYEPNNCHWATYEEQANNRHTNVVLDDGRTLAEFVKENKLNYFKASYLFHLGHSLEEIVNAQIS